MTIYSASFLTYFNIRGQTVKQLGTVLFCLTVSADSAAGQTKKNRPQVFEKRADTSMCQPHLTKSSFELIRQVALGPGGAVAPTGVLLEDAL